MVSRIAAAAKSLQSCPTLCDPIDSSPPGSPSLGFSRQEHWSGLPFPSPMHESEKWKGSHSVVSDSQRPHGLQPTRFLRPWDFPGKSTGVGCHCLLQVTRIRWGHNVSYKDQYPYNCHQRACSILLSALFGFRKMAICEPGGVLLPDSRSSGTLILDFQPPELYQINVFFFFQVNVCWKSLSLLVAATWNESLKGVW